MTESVKKSKIIAQNARFCAIYCEVSEKFNNFAEFKASIHS